jgi:LPXTG-site transpeptidase (sortase) family protein
MAVRPNGVCGLAALAAAALALLLAACGGVVEGEDQDIAPRPNVSSVQKMEPARTSRADEYRATATALELEAEANGQASAAGAQGDEFDEVFRLLRLPAANHVSIPSLDIDAPVEDVGTELKDGRLIWSVIASTVGHHRASANPGEPGNIVLTGHVVSRSGVNVFLRLPDIQVGAEVLVTSPAGEFRYIVTEISILPDTEIGILSHGYDEKLTLITCVNDGIYDQRVVVTALPAEMAASG